MFKKGQTLGLNGIVVALVLFVVIAILALVFFQVNDSLITNLPSSSATTSNETVTLTVAGTSLSQSILPLFSITSSTVTNATGGEVVSTGNYTISSAGLIQATATSNYTNQAVNVTYTYNYQGDATGAYNSSVSMRDAGTNITSNMPLVGTVIIFGIIIAIIAVFFLRGRNAV